MDKPKVGDEVWIVPTNRRGRINLNSGSLCAVTKVGRKYFYVECGGYCENIVDFRLDNWRQNTSFTTDFRVYKNEKDYTNEIEINRWEHTFNNSFGNWGARNKYELSQYKQAAEIFGITLED